jgi:hypothetical protein
MKRLAILAGVLISAVVFSFTLVWINYGKESALIFANVLNALTAFCLLLVTTAYVVVTAKILETSGRSVQQQEQLAAMMRQDLRVRIAPSLNWRSGSGPTSELPCFIKNEGPGIALKVSGTFKYSSQVTNDLNLPREFAVNREQRVLVNANNAEEIVLSCSDSLGLAKYTWRYRFNGDLISYDVTTE